MNKPKAFCVKVEKHENEAMQRLVAQKAALSSCLGDVQKDIGNLWEAMDRKYGLDYKKRRVVWDHKKCEIKEMGHST